MAKPKIGIMYLTSCAGCQCEILNYEEALLKLLDLTEIKYFPIGSSANTLDEELDVLFVEGSVSSSLDEEMVKKGREKAKILVAIGTCACFGGIQANNNDVPLEELLETVYGTTDMPFEITHARPVEEVVKVDYSLPGCPVDGKQFVYAAAFLLNGVKPFFPKMAVCYECKLSETECRTLQGLFCLGPITAAGCGAPCTSKGLGCQGCRGDHDAPNYRKMVEVLSARGLKGKDLINFMKVFRGNYLKEKLKDAGVE
ncbi:NADH:ubiquinone oxidoreductase [Desulfurobacterium sp.]|uniref:NADH-quinone oxidoreductase subunit B family protein n=1 Tax=Desulfurobacterium sp. TaxID=2004706 RepID=UPI00262A26A1|nr:NADH:ubiquinone oxidoreductase [Desulfurobacterium sp.]